MFYSYSYNFAKLLKININDEVPLTLLNLDSMNLHQIMFDVLISNNYNIIQVFPCINYFYASAYFSCFTCINI